MSYLIPPIVIHGGSIHDKDDTNSKTDTKTTTATTSSSSSGSSPAQSETHTTSVMNPTLSTQLASSDEDKRKETQSESNGDALQSTTPTATTTSLKGRQVTPSGTTTSSLSTNLSHPSPTPQTGRRGGSVGDSPYGGGMNGYNTQSTRTVSADNTVPTVASPTSGKSRPKVPYLPPNRFTNMASYPETILSHLTQRNMFSNNYTNSPTNSGISMSSAAGRGRQTYGNMNTARTSTALYPSSMVRTGSGKASGGTSAGVTTTSSMNAKTIAGTGTGTGVNSTMPSSVSISNLKRSNSSGSGSNNSNKNKTNKNGVGNGMGYDGMVGMGNQQYGSMYGSMSRGYDMYGNGSMHRTDKMYSGDGQMGMSMMNPMSGYMNQGMRMNGMGMNGMNGMGMNGMRMQGMQGMNGMQGMQGMQGMGMSNQGMNGMNQANMMAMEYSPGSTSTPAMNGMSYGGIGTANTSMTVMGNPNGNGNYYPQMMMNVNTTTGGKNMSYMSPSKSGWTRLCVGMSQMNSMRTVNQTGQGMMPMTNLSGMPHSVATDMKRSSSVGNYSYMVPGMVVDQDGNITASK